MQALVKKHLPGQEGTVDNMGLALFLDRKHWEELETAVANGISKAIKGR